jgi:DNA-binding MarR family transcriptional regulator
MCGSLGDLTAALDGVHTTSAMTKRPTSTAERISRECLGMPVRMLHRAVSAVYDDALREQGLGLAQMNLLVAVERLGERATPSQLGRVLMLEKSSVSREVDRLVERRWVTRSTGADGRSQLLALTAQGRRTLEAALPSWETAQARVRALLGDAGADMLLSMVDRIRAAEPPPASGPAPSSR